MSPAATRIIAIGALLLPGVAVGADQCETPWQGLMAAESRLRNSVATQAEIDADARAGDVVDPAWRSAVAWAVEYNQLLRDIHAGTGSDLAPRAQQLLEGAEKARSDRAVRVAELLSVAARLPPGLMPLPLQTLESWIKGLAAELDALHANPQPGMGDTLPVAAALPLEAGIAHAAQLSGDPALLAYALTRLETLAENHDQRDASSSAQLEYLQASVLRAITMSGGNRAALWRALERFESAARAAPRECSPSIAVDALLGAARTRLDLAAVLTEGPERSDLVLAAVDDIESARRIADPVTAPLQWQRAMRTGAEVYDQAAHATGSPHAAKRFRWLSNRMSELGL